MVRAGRGRIGAVVFGVERRDIREAVVPHRVWVESDW